MLPNLPRGPVLVMLGFLASIITGTILLGLPQAVVPGHSPLSLEQAFFTATSAVCVTGLTVFDTASTLSPLGQGMVLAMFQLGGIGVMTLALLVFEVFSRQFRAEREDVLDSSLGSQVWTHGARQTLSLVLIYTLAVESIGFMVLAPSFWGEQNGLFQALFLAVSAFCNAGFDISPGGLERFATSWEVALPLALMWLLGGFGFMLPALWRERRRYGPSAPTDPVLRMLLRAGLMLMVLGPICFWLSEAGGVLEQFSWDQQILVSFFQGNTTRTAGFSLVDLSAVSRHSLLVMIPFMLIGGSPGGTAGGIKTTTAWIFLATMASHARGQSKVVLLDRRIPTHTLRRAVLVVGMMACLWCLLTVLLTLYDSGNRFSLEQLAFESASALGTVGLSTGVTGELPLGGQMCLAVAMFIGRLGPLTIAFLLFQPQQDDCLEYQRAEIPVG